MLLLIPDMTYFFFLWCRIISPKPKIPPIVLIRDSIETFFDLTEMDLKFTTPLCIITLEKKKYFKPETIIEKISINGIRNCGIVIEKNEKNIWMKTAKIIKNV